MERKSLWKNFLLLTIGSLFALHMNMSQAADSTSQGTNVKTSTTTSAPTDSCVLEAE